MVINLSPSKLSVLRECRRCFWLTYHGKVIRPMGAFPSLPTGMDRVMKGYLDQFRGGLPPELVGQVPGVLYADLTKLNKWRNWRSGLSAILEVKDMTVKLCGAIDDLLYDGTTDTYSPYDVKTKGQAIKNDGAIYYQQQLNLYSLLLRENGMPPSGRAFLHYVWPETVNGIAVVKFSGQVCELMGSAEQALDTLAEAVTILTGPLPVLSSDCEYCAYAVSYRRVSMAYEETGEASAVAVPEAEAVPAESAT